MMTFDLTGLAMVLIAIVVIIMGLLIALRLLSPGDERLAARQVSEAALDEGRFLQGFLRPLYEDGVDHLDTAVEIAREALDFYAKGAYVDAGEGFIAAGRSAGDAARKFREVLGMVEDPAVDYARLAKVRLAEGKQLREWSRGMEAACDAAIAGNETEAAAQAEKARHLRAFIDQWKKE